jgi:hypothetical protein
MRRAIADPLQYIYLHTNIFSAFSSYSRQTAPLVTARD